ncbi:MAG TPA: aldehyde dehydrogenase (NADP(+)) [Verrucomicrobiae bacterium]|nr:aldehyde dehydrogenase (NADP(+)) [Verrucomicrobiae bacterium]
MQLTGKNLIAGKDSATGLSAFTGINPATGEALQPEFFEASDSEIDHAMRHAEEAFADYSRHPAERVAGFLERVAEEITSLGSALIDRAKEETALPESRLIGERGRTVAQLKMFAEVVREGSWVDARIDRAIPDRKPLPKPDLRRKLIPIGPVVVFGASNFPLAFSVAGGDTASALAAGKPVVVKAHPAHPGTTELEGRAIVKAAQETEMPAGVFSLLHGRRHEISLRLVRHSGAKAVGFTGSLAAGRALFDAAAARPEPIPVYAEMGSVNPVFVLPGALKARCGAIAETLVQSVALGVGQFCTNPGLVFSLDGEGFAEFVARAGKAAGDILPGTMLYHGICERFQQGVERFRKLNGVTVAGESNTGAASGQSGAVVFSATAKVFLNEPRLREELFGPATVIIACGSSAELEQAARELPGQLTATIHGTEDDLRGNSRLVGILQQKVGRLLFNGFPTGVEVCPSMHHGGPYPATTDSHFTSVGTAAIQRFARPICFQGFPESALPPELRDRNQRQIWRCIDGALSKADL